MTVFWILLSTIGTVLLGCGTLRNIVWPEDFRQLPAYASQKRIIWQGYTQVPIPNGSIASVFFGYSRKSRLTPVPTSAGGGIDILEFKKLNADGSWQWSPFLIFCDDDADQIADRLFIDADCDGRIDSVHDITRQHIRMIDIRFDRLMPLLERLGPVRML